MDDSVRKLRDERMMAADFFTANPKINSIVYIGKSLHKPNGDVVQLKPVSNPKGVE